jgi:HEAT repeat protein
MTGIQLAQYVVLVVFSLNALMLLSMILLKTIHRRRIEKHDRRHSEYVVLLSRHLTFENCTDHISPKMAADRAFLDALIDVRNAVVGPEIETLRGIVDRYGVVQSLSKSLTKRWPLGRRLGASVALAELGDESSVQLLMDHIDDPEPEIRIQAARGLGRMQWTPAIDAIIDRIGIEEPWVRSRFAGTLVGFGVKATWPLAAYLRVNHRYETAGAVTAIQTLATIGDYQATIPVLEVMDDATDAEVSIAVIEALGLLGGPLVIEPLQKAVTSGDWRMRAKAATALGDIEDPSSRGALATSLRDENFWVRRNSAAALTHIPGGTEVLHEALEGDDAYAGDAAAEALIDRGDLAHARDRVHEGSATDEDYRLLAFVSEDESVAS